MFPALAAGAEDGDATSLYWLARTAQNLYSAQALHRQVDFRTELQFLREAHTRDSGSDWIRAALLDATIQLFQHAEHEWPAGILDGMNGADTAGCDGYLEEIEFARTLDREGRQTAYLDSFERKVELYRNRIAATEGVEA